MMDKEASALCAARVEKWYIKNSEEIRMDGVD
jgi:hypothetical protein